MIWPFIAAAVVVVNTVLSWSDWVVGLITGPPDGEPGALRLPGWILMLLEARPDTGDAEVHLVIWAAAAVAVTMAVRTPRRLVPVLVAVWAWSVVVEALQPVITDRRGFEWIDVVGNTVGVVVGAGAVLGWRYRTRIFPLRAAARWAVVAVVLAGVMVSMWSLSMMEWWAEVSSAERNPLVRLRPETNEADLHAAVWFGVSVLVIWAVGLRASQVGAWRRWAAALVVVFAVSWAIEWIQPRLSFRRYNVLDLIGNAAGVLAAAVLATVLTWWQRRQLSKPDRRPGGDDPQPQM
jgi:glycopeptide antibiotics resistance protein